MYLLLILTFYKFVLLVFFLFHQILKFFCSSSMARYVYTIQTEMTSLKASNRQLQAMVGHQGPSQDFVGQHVSRTLLSRIVYRSVMCRLGCCVCVFIAFYVSSLLFVGVIVSSGDVPKMEISTQLITYLKINLNAFSVALVFLVMI